MKDKIVNIAIISVLPLLLYFYDDLGKEIVDGIHIVFVYSIIGYFIFEKLKIRVLYSYIISGYYCFIVVFTFLFNAVNDDAVVLEKSYRHNGVVLLLGLIILFIFFKHESNDN